VSEFDYDDPSPWPGIVVLGAFVLYLAAITGLVIAIIHRFL